MKNVVWIHFAHLRTFSGRGVHTERKQLCESGAGSRTKRFGVRWCKDLASSNLMDPTDPLKSCMQTHWIQSKMMDVLSQVTLYIYKSYLLSCCNLLEQCKWTSYWVKFADSNICLVYLPTICWLTNLVEYISHYSTDKNPPTQVTNSKFQLFPSQREAAFYW